MSAEVFLRACHPIVPHDAVEEGSLLTVQAKDAERPSIMARRWPRQSRGPPAKGMNVCAGLAAPDLSSPSSAAAAAVAAPVAVHLGAPASRAPACMQA